MASELKARAGSVKGGQPLNCFRIRRSQFYFETAIGELRTFEFADNGLGMLAGDIDKGVPFAQVHVSDG
jgi:hypothetical protein